MNDPEKGIFPGVVGDRSEWGKCGCYSCVSAVVALSQSPFSQPFVVCDLCGNKRCPKATHHNNECSGSNEPGQAGSRYA